MKINRFILRRLSNAFFGYRKEPRVAKTSRENSAGRAKTGAGPTKDERENSCKRMRGRCIIRAARTISERVRMGLFSGRKRNIVYLSSLVVMLVCLTVAGCGGFRSDQSGKGAATGQKKLESPGDAKSKANDTAVIRDIEPSKDTAEFYKAVKGANKVVIIAGDLGDPLEDREQVPLNAFDSHEIEFWHILNAIASAITLDKSLEQESDYVIRWYDDYKKLGEAKINKESGLTGLRYIVSASGKLESQSNIISGNVFIPKENLAVIKDAAAAFLNQREEELEKARKGTSRGQEI